MKFRILLFFLFSLITAPLTAVVGDWVSHGSRLDLTHLHLNGNILSAASLGGVVRFDIGDEKFSTVTNTDFLEHIDLLTYYVNHDSSQWISYN
ncbi:MAG: hypothetical protein K0B52_06005, partial [FCB group bacterium]|nr:hypothetical protein [FCB group bacterium]